MLGYWYNIRTETGIEGWSYGYYLLPFREIDYDGIQMSYAETISRGMKGEVKEPSRGYADAPAFPERIHLMLDGYVIDAANKHANRILFFPLKGPKALDGFGGDSVEKLIEMLAAKERRKDQRIPAINYHGGNQMYVSQIKFLDFQNGSGIRFITLWVSDGVWPVPIDCVYQYQGITTDGSWWVSAEFTVKRPKVDADQKSVTNRELYYEHWRLFEKDLDSKDLSSFIPDLALLDIMINSLSVNPN